MDHERIYLIKQLVNFILTHLKKYKTKKHNTIISFSKHYKQQQKN